MTSEALVSWSDEQLRNFADEYLGIFIPAGTSRNLILQRIVNTSMVARDGL